MSHNEKVRKLGTAIRAYRGRYHRDTMKWMEPPQPRAFYRIVRWCGELKLNVAEAVAAINNFKSFGEYRDWISKV